MIACCHKLAVITISEKLNSAFNMKICSPQQIDYLITELKPSDKKLVAYKKNMTIL